MITTENEAIDFSDKIKALVVSELQELMGLPQCNVRQILIHAFASNIYGIEQTFKDREFFNDVGAAIGAHEINIVNQECEDEAREK